MSGASELTRLELLEQGGREADAALEALKERWAAEDALRETQRAMELERHAEGARVRETTRQAWGGPAKPVVAEDPVASVEDPVEVPAPEEPPHDG